MGRVYTDYAVFDIDRDAGAVHVRQTYGITVVDLASRMAVELH